jgi:hypothetical protein
MKITIMTRFFAKRNMNVNTCHVGELEIGYWGLGIGYWGLVDWGLVTFFIETIVLIFQSPVTNHQ